MSGQGAALKEVVTMLKRGTERLLDLPYKPVDPDKAGQVPDDAIDTDGMIADIRRASESLATLERETFLATQAVQGTGPAAGRIRQMYSALLEEFPHDAPMRMRERFTANIKPLLSLAALSDAKKVANGQLKDTGFARAIADGTLEVEITGMGRLSVDPDEALDQLARHVAGRDDATFTTLDPLARRKVALIAGLLGDNAAKAIADGFGLALDPEGGRNLLAISGNAAEKRRVTVDAAGGTMLKVKIETERTGATLRTGAESYRLGPGSVVKTGYLFKLGNDDMRKFDRETDLDAFDGTAAEEIATAPGTAPGRADRVKDALGKPFLIGYGRNVASATFVLN